MPSVRLASQMVATTTLPSTERLLELVERFAGQRRPGAGRPGGGSFHHRHAEADQPRGAGAHPARIRARVLTPGRRGERGRQRGRARRRPAAARRGGRRRRTAAGCSPTWRERGVDDRGDRRPARLSHADQDPHPRRRQALDQAADRALRHRGDARTLDREERERFAALLDALGRRGAASPSSRDYGYGAVEPALLPRMRDALGERATLLCDSRYRLGELRRARRRHAQRGGGRGARSATRSTTIRTAWSAAGRSLRERLGARFLLITRGSRGMSLFADGRVSADLPVYGTDQVADVTGAGDTVIGTFALALAAGADSARGGAARQLRRRRRGDEDGHRHLLARGAVAARSRATPARWRSCGGPRPDGPASSAGALAGAQGRRGGRWPSPTVTSISCTSVTCATCEPPAPRRTCWSWRSTTTPRSRASRARAGRSSPRPSGPSCWPRWSRSTSWSIFDGDSPGPLLADAPAGRALQGDRLRLARAGARVRGRARLRRPHGAGGRSQGPRDERSDRQGAGPAGRARRDAAPRMRILLVRTSALGDVVHALPVLTALRRHSPGGADRLGGRGGDGARCSPGHPDLDELLRGATAGLAAALSRRDAARGSAASLRRLRALRARRDARPDGEPQGGRILARLAGAAGGSASPARHRREPSSAVWINRPVVAARARTPSDRMLSLLDALGLPSRAADFGPEKLFRRSRTAARQLLAAASRALRPPPPRRRRGPTSATRRPGGGRRPRRLQAETGLPTWVAAAPRRGGAGGRGRGGERAARPRAVPRRRPADARGADPPGAADAGRRHRPDPPRARPGHAARDGHGADRSRAPRPLRRAGAALVQVPPLQLLLPAASPRPRPACWRSPRQVAARAGGDAARFHGPVR